MNYALEALNRERLDYTSKGLPFIADVAPSKVRRNGWNILNGDLPFPLMVLKESALEYNLKAMDEWCAENNFLLAPHGKTTMCPQLYERQLACGAWAITVATVSQAMVCVRFGIQRIFIANQVIGDGNFRALAALLGAGSNAEIYCLLDSVAGLQQLITGLQKFGAQRVINVLLEVGRKGWRTGIRSPEQFTDIYHEAVKYPEILSLRGIEAFEGSASDAGEVDEFLAEFKMIGECFLKLWQEAEKPLLSIGGTAYLDRVLLLSREISSDFQFVVRSGCYVTHDHGLYQRKHQTSQLRIRGTARLPDFRPALELWSYVQSIPENHYAFLTFGKRDTSHDIDLPVPLFSIRGNQRQRLTDAQVVKLQDQHAYLSFGDGVDLQIGDLVCCGISHPCTAFDKWRVLPVVNDDYDVIDLYRTFF